MSLQAVYRHRRRSERSIQASMNHMAIMRTLALTYELEAKGVVLQMNNWGEQTECGTVGCLGGWMTLDPELRVLGLRNAADYKQPYEEPLKPIFPCRSGGLRQGGSALAGLFDVPGNLVSDIFDSQREPSWFDLQEKLAALVEKGAFYDPR